MQHTTPAAGTPGAALTAVAGALSVPAHALRVAVGQEVAARVLAVAGGVVDLAVAGGRMSARTALPLQPGQTLRLVVSTADAERVTLRPAPIGGTGPTADAAGRSPAFGALRAAGFTTPTAGALLAALAEAGVPPPTADAAARLGARAAQAGVSGRSLATAFVRLDTAGLPATPAAVAGLAALAHGPAVGRALAAVIDAARAAAPTIGDTAAPPPASRPSAGGAAIPQAPPPAATSPAPSAPSATPAGSVPAPGGGPAPAHPSPAPGAAPPAGGTAPMATALAGLVDRIARDVASGDVAALRAAIADLGAGLEARLARGDVPRDAPVRALLSALASHPATEPALARAAAGLADAVAAQPLAVAAGGHTPTGPPAPGGAYLQLPLPGGGTVEVRVDPDAAGDEEGGGAPAPRRVAFLLDLSALGSVMVMATATGDADPVDARVRAADDGVRSFLAHNISELAAALGTDGSPARVRVEALARATPERLIAPPPATGLDRRA